MIKNRNEISDADSSHMVKKILLVLFITMLIWVWADLSQDEVYRDSTAVLHISQAADPGLWVRFVSNNATELPLKQIKIEGPAIRIAELKRDIAEGLVQLRFELDPDELGLVDSDSPYTVPLTQFLSQNQELRKRGLKVTETAIENVQVLATQLVEKRLQVVPLDENNIPIENADINPQQIKMRVPPEWQGLMLRAYVRMTVPQIIRARKEAIAIKPFIEFVPGVVRTSETPVEIKLPEDGLNLLDKPVQGSLGYVVSPDILEQYIVVIDNPGDFTSTIQIKATEEAYQDYNSQKYKLLLEIQGDDARKELVTRSPEYNFPMEYVRRGEILPVKRPERARFRLIPRN